MAAPTKTIEGIVLELGSYSLSIQRFGSFPGRYPRVHPNGTRVARSQRNTPARRGSQSYPPGIWTFDARLTLEQEETLNRMEGLYWASRTGWTLYDYTLYYAEGGGVNTRAIAPNTTATTDGTTVLYYPQWQAEPTQDFRYSEVGEDGHVVVSMQFTETGVIAA